ncbi:MAG TPA: hypothetical protein VM285_08115, partial [Polyangia bacterium]|nr:hypothetical protein [Polyangia bacterium]
RALISILPWFENAPRFRVVFPVGPDSGLLQSQLAIHLPDFLGFVKRHCGTRIANASGLGLIRVSQTSGSSFPNSLMIGRESFPGRF